MTGEKNLAEALDFLWLMILYNHKVIELMGYGMQLGGAQARQLDITFAALADPPRRALLARAGAGEASGQEGGEPFAMSQPAISKHLKVLERAGLVSRGRDAQRRPRRLEPKRLGEATKW